MLNSTLNSPQKIDGLTLLQQLKTRSIPCVFFDPQYRGLLERQKYGNEGKNREIRRCSLKQMTEHKILDFVVQINRILKPSGHLFLWTDKFHLCEGVKRWFNETDLQIVDLVIWEKPRLGMGYRTRNKAEFLVVLQKKPLKAKGIWKRHDIPNVYREDSDKNDHVHAKPIGLQQKLLEAVTEEGDLVVDPAMGSGSVYYACLQAKRNFIGGDINGFNEKIQTGEPFGKIQKIPYEKLSTLNT